MTMLHQHPLSAAFPAMPAEDFAALCADIKANGLIQPIVLFESQVIDGWHRYQACVAADIEARSSLLPAGVDPVAFVKSVNGHRRHLTASQRGMAFATCDGSKWAKAGRPGNSVPGTEFPAATGLGAPAAPITVAEAAKEADVSTSTMGHAKAVVAKAIPEIAEAVRDGKVSAKVGAKLARLPKAKQAAALQKALQPKPKGKPAAKTVKKKAQEQEPAANDPDLESPAEMMAGMQRDLDTLNALVQAADADDQKAEALKWRRAYDAAVRGQSEAMDRAHKSVEREKATKRQLMRCGKAVGEDDEFKIAPAVEAMARAYKAERKVAA